MARSILIIGGSSSVRGELASNFTQAGFATAEVPDYFEALGKLGRFRPDLIIIDEKMPSMVCWEACSALRLNYGIPVVVLGRQPSQNMWQRVLEAGADFYQTEPLEYAVFVVRVKAILRRYPKFRRSS